MTVLNEIEGNLIDMLENDETDVVIHQTNCFQSLGEGVSSGIARALADQYPILKKRELDEFSKGDINQLGEILITIIKTKSGLKKYIINIYSQYHYGPIEGTSPTSYKAMRLGLETADSRLFKYRKDLRVSTYQLGCNRGGADWDTVKNILQNKLPSVHKLDIVSFKTK